MVYPTIVPAASLIPSTPSFSPVAALECFNSPLDRPTFPRKLGRAQEFATLHACLDKAIAGAGQFVTVMGEGGVGKSRLLYEFRYALDRSRIAIREGRCQSYGQSTPYLPWLDAARRALQLREDDTPEQRLDKVVTNILAIDPSLEQFVPHYLHLFSIPSTPFPLPPHLRGEALQRALQEALAATYMLYAQQRPMVVIFEDWHWADEASDAALRYLISVAGAYPILLIVLYRPSEYRANWELLAMALNIMGRSCLFSTDYAKGFEYLEQGIPLMENLGNLEEVAYSTGMLACLYGYTGQFRQAYLSAQKTLELSQRIANKTRMALSLVYTGFVQLEQGSFAASIANWADSAEQCQQMGNQVVQGVAIGAQGYGVVMLGEAATGVHMLRSGIDLVEATGSRFCLSWLYGSLAECQALAGNAEEAVMAAEKCLKVRRFGDRWKEQQAYRALALAAALSRILTGSKSMRTLPRACVWPRAKTPGPISPLPASGTPHCCGTGPITNKPRTPCSGPLTCSRR